MCVSRAVGVTCEQVRREASVTALQDSWCLRMRAADVADMPSHDFYALHKIFIAKLLADVRVPSIRAHYTPIPITCTQY